MKDFWGLWSVVFFMVFVPGVGVLLTAPFLIGTRHEDISGAFAMAGVVLIGVAACWVGLYFLFKRLSR